MNKILPYMVIAILLGTVTMVVPLALLGPSDYTSMTEGSTLIQPSPTELPTSEPAEPPPETEQLDSKDYTEGGDLLSGDSLTPAPSAPTETPTPTTTPAPAELASTETDLIIESLSVLSPIGLMTIPSFLIALGAFIYLKKRRT